MSAGLGVVSTEVRLHLVLPGTAALPVRAALRYDPMDPYAVTTAFYAGSGSLADVVEWTFARQLLTDGVSAPVGVGDVQVWPAVSSSGPIICLSLSSPSGKALFEVPVVDVVGFLADTYVVVPTGSEGEHVDVDAELAGLLRGDPEA